MTVSKNNMDVLLTMYNVIFVLQSSGFSPWLVLSLQVELDVVHFQSIVPSRLTSSPEEDLY